MYQGMDWDKKKVIRKDAHRYGGNSKSCLGFSPRLEALEEEVFSPREERLKRQTSVYNISDTSQSDNFMLSKKLSRANSSSTILPGMTKPSMSRSALYFVEKEESTYNPILSVSASNLTSKNEAETKANEKDQKLDSSLRTLDIGDSGARRRLDRLRRKRIDNGEKRLRKSSADVVVVDKSLEESLELRKKNPIMKRVNSNLEKKKKRKSILYLEKDLEEEISSFMSENVELYNKNKEKAELEEGKIKQKEREGVEMLVEMVTVMENLTLTLTQISARGLVEEDKQRVLEVLNAVVLLRWLTLIIQTAQ
eukprot:TRINITY_DN15798_c0_g1_i1.p1 TRINITY_DN15798_c0_g1~~TRINITY_DN15798_c0_g1_i1.p1  ORF type:complete len:309 (+),score=74.30 TRINITY_DN15798_c0_g1_i1:147-1073(+)